MSSMSLTLRPHPWLKCVVEWALGVQLIFLALLSIAFRHLICLTWHVRISLRTEHWTTSTSAAHISMMSSNLIPSLGLNCFLGM